MYSDKHLFSKEHEWIEVDGDTALIGITDHAQQQLGDIVYVDLPELDAEFSAGDEFGSVESVKAVAEVFMPVDGEILEVNEMLEESPETVNQDPHAAGWLIKVKLSNPAQLEGLMDHKAYAEFVAQES